MRHMLCVSMTLLFLSPYTAAQQTKKTHGEGDPQVIGLLMYADWCRSCKVLEPKLNDVKREFEGKGIFFTRFDMTDDFTIEQSSLYASWVGLEDIFKDNEGRTGYMLLIDPTSKKILAKLVKTQSTDEIRNSIQATLR